MQNAYFWGTCQDPVASREQFGWNEYLIAHRSVWCHWSCGRNFPSDICFDTCRCCTCVLGVSRWWNSSPKGCQSKLGVSPWSSTRTYPPASRRDREVLSPIGVGAARLWSVLLQLRCTHGPCIQLPSVWRGIFVFYFLIANEWASMSSIMILQVLWNLQSWIWTTKKTLKHAIWLVPRNVKILKFWLHFRRFLAVFNPKKGIISQVTPFVFTTVLDKLLCIFTQVFDTHVASAFADECSGLTLSMSVLKWLTQGDCARTRHGL